MTNTINHNEKNDLDGTKFYMAHRKSLKNIAHDSQKINKFEQKKVHIGLAENSKKEPATSFGIFVKINSYKTKFNDT